MASLKDYISFNSEFRSSVNLYLSLNKEDKINSFIPTKSSVNILKQYLEAVVDNKRQATLLLGPYGKGKSHLLLVLLAILSLDRGSKSSVKVVRNLESKPLRFHRASKGYSLLSEFYLYICYSVAFIEYDRYLLMIMAGSSE